MTTNAGDTGIRDKWTGHAGCHAGRAFAANGFACRGRRRPDGGGPGRIVVTDWGVSTAPTTGNTGRGGSPATHSRNRWKLLP